MSGYAYDISQAMQDIAIVTMECEQECDLSNGTISNDLERTLTCFQGHTVTPLFDAKYLKRLQIRPYSYYRRRIANCTQAFEWHQFQWPLTQISRSRYYSTSNNSKMVQGRAIFKMADQ